MVERVDEYSFFFPLLKTSEQPVSLPCRVSDRFAVCADQLPALGPVLLFIRSLIVIVVETRTIRTGFLGETTSRRGWNGELLPHVEQNVRLALRDSVCARWPHRTVIEVKPLTVVNSEGSVMSGSGT